MKMTEHLLDKARHLDADPPRSKLDNHAEVIWELRRKRKRICTIAAFLTEHGVRVGKSTVARWLKSHPVPKQATGETPSHPTVPTPAPRPAIEQASRDFFNPPKPKHENQEHWNRPD
jgi:hypothetical protein